MRDYAAETEARVAFIRDILSKSGAGGIVFGNSGGKDSALVGILCKKACQNTVGVIMPCQSTRNYGEDNDDALALADMYGIETLRVDLTAAKEAVLGGLSLQTAVSPSASSNINPRLRMTALYAVAQSRGFLVSGTGNLSERYTGYFTKWGDGACDFNPIGDLTVREIYEFLAHLGAPENIIKKAPSAGLFEGQTDEGEMGFTYAELDEYLLTGKGPAETIAKIEKMHTASEHKRLPIPVYGGK